MIRKPSDIDDEISQMIESDPNETEPPTANEALVETAEKFLLQQTALELLTKTYKDFIFFRKVILGAMLIYMGCLSIFVLGVVRFIVCSKENIQDYQSLLQLLIGGLLIQIISILYFITKYIFSTEEFKEIQKFTKSTYDRY